MALSTSRTVLTQTGINTFLNYDIGGLNSAGIATFSNFKTGSTNVHSVGVEAAGINVLGGDTPIGAGATIYDDGGARFVGVVTASSFSGNGANLTGIDATTIQTGTTKVVTSATLISNQISGAGIATVQAGGLDVTGIVTATTFKGSGANLTSLPAANLTGTLPAIDGSNLTGIAADKIFEGNTEVETIDTGSDGHVKITTEGNERVRVNHNGKVVVGNTGTTFGNAAVQAFIQHGNTAGESGFSSVDTTSVAAGVGGEIAFHGKYNTGAQDYAYTGHIRGIKENATAGNTACALTFHTRPNAVAPQERLRIESTGIANFKQAVGIGSYTSTQRDAIAYLQSGTLIFNSTTGTCQIWDGNAWTNLTDPFAASGGTKTTSGDKTIHTFTSSGTFSVTSNSSTVRVLIVGGGGAGGGHGGNDGSGGGGAGLVRFVTGIPVSPSPGSYPIVVGGGGGATGGGTLGLNGNSSSAFSNTSPGGGGGGAESPSPRAGRPGGSGGGAGGYGGGSGGTGDGDPGAPTDNDNIPHGNSPSNGWGCDGGLNQYPGGTNHGGGGGGGAQHDGMPGKNPNSVPTQYAMHTYSGNGGNGIGYSITGSPVFYAGGGGSGGNGHHGNNGPGSYGGRGGGGNGGGGPFGSADSGSPATGSGGGGAAASNSPAPNHNSGAGGSGIVIIDYDT